MSKTVGVGSGPGRRGCPRRWQRFREAAGLPASGRRRGGDVARLSLVFSVAVVMALGAGPVASRAQNAGGAAPSSPAGASGPAAGGPLGNVTVEEWLNQTVRLRDTVQALDRPPPMVGRRARSGRAPRIKAIGLVAGRQLGPDRVAQPGARLRAEGRRSSSKESRRTGIGRRRARPADGGDARRGAEILRSCVRRGGANRGDPGGGERAGRDPRARGQCAQRRDIGGGRSAHPPVGHRSRAAERPRHHSKTGSRPRARCSANRMRIPDAIAVSPAPGSTSPRRRS